MLDRPWRRLWNPKHLEKRRTYLVDVVPDSIVLLLPIQYLLQYQYLYLYLYAVLQKPHANMLRTPVLQYVAPHHYRVRSTCVHVPGTLVHKHSSIVPGTGTSTSTTSTDAMRAMHSQVHQPHLRHLANLSLQPSISSAYKHPAPSFFCSISVYQRSSISAYKPWERSLLLLPRHHCYGFS